MYRHAAGLAAVARIQNAGAALNAFFGRAQEPRIQRLEILYVQALALPANCQHDA